MSSRTEMIGEIVIDAEMKALGQAFVKEFYAMQFRIKALEAELAELKHQLPTPPADTEQDRADQALWESILDGTWGRNEH